MASVCLLTWLSCSSVRPARVVGYHGLAERPANVVQFMRHMNGRLQSKAILASTQGVGYFSQSYTTDGLAVPKETLSGTRKDLNEVTYDYVSVDQQLDWESAY